MTVYSYSRLGTYRQCPLKYRFGYVDRMPRKGTTVEAFLGSRFHEVMEHLYGQRTRTPSAEELKELFLGLWERKWNEDVRIVQRDRSAEDYKATGLRAIEDYHRRYSPFDQGRTLGIERELSLKLDGGDGHRLRCIIDRLTAAPDGTFEIHDYKTSGFLPEQARVDEDEQLALYEMAVRQAWPDVGGVELVWHYVAFDMELRSRRTGAQLAELAMKTRERIDEIERASEFPPRESTLCAWCDYQEQCPLFAHRHETSSLPLEEYATDDAIGLVNRYAALDEKRHELGQELKRLEAQQERLKAGAVEIAQRKGVRRLFGDRHFLTMRDDLKVSYPKKGEIARQGFEERLREMGLEGQVMDLSWSAVKSLAEREGWSGESGPPAGLAEYLKVERSTQVRLSRRKDIEEDNENKEQ
jgi:putative RecB family exonuclease